MEKGIKPEIEIFDAGMLGITDYFVKKGHLPILFAALALGGHVRVGMEDNVVFGVDEDGKKVMATNHMLVERGRAYCVWHVGRQHLWRFFCSAYAVIMAKKSRLFTMLIALRRLLQYTKATIRRAGWLCHVKERKTTNQGGGTMDIKQKHLLFPGSGALTAFACQFILFQLTESLVNDRAAALLGVETVNAVYSAGLFSTASGYLLFAFMSWRIGSAARKVLLACMGVAYLCSSTCMARTAQPPVFVACALAGLLSAGYLGGLTHWILAAALRDGRYTGRATGAAIAAGIGLQYLVQSLLPMPAALAVWLAAAVFIVAFGYRCSRGDCFSAPPSARSGPEPLLRRRLFVLIAAVILMSMIISLDDTICVTFHAQGSVNLYGAPRLFYAGSVLLAGFLADRRGRAYLPLATVCVVLISGFTFAFLSRPDTYWINACLLYTYSGFYVEFFTVMFLAAAPRSGCPELWAGMGRITRSYTLAIVTVPFIRLFDAFGVVPMMVLSTVFSMGCLVLFFTSGMLSPARTGETPPSDFRSLEGFAQKHHLTPRETDVLERLLTTDDDLQEIADSLYISRRMVQRYVSSIYEKTETKTRIGLFRNYMDFTTD